MIVDFYLLIACFAGLAVAWGLFLQAAVIVQQRKSAWSLVFKLLGTVALCLALYFKESDVSGMIGLFFAVLILSLGLFTLARQRLLR